MCSPIIEKYGASPANIQWTVVRGDTAILRVDFLDDDEVTIFDTRTWTYTSSAYDSSGGVLDNLTVTSGAGYAEIKVEGTTTANWGTKYVSVVAELPFDLQVVITDEGTNTRWTPVVGTICVLGNVSPAGRL